MTSTTTDTDSKIEVSRETEPMLHHGMKGQKNLRVSSQRRHENSTEAVRLEVKEKVVRLKLQKKMN